MAENMERSMQMMSNANKMMESFVLHSIDISRKNGCLLISSSVYPSHNKCRNVWSINENCQQHSHPTQTPVLTAWTRSMQLNRFDHFICSFIHRDIQAKLLPWSSFFLTVPNPSRLRRNTLSCQLQEQFPRVLSSAWPHPYIILLANPSRLIYSVQSTSHYL